MEIDVVEMRGGMDDFPILIQDVDSRIADGARGLVLDLHTLPMINSAALGYLIGARKRIEGQGGELVLCRLQPALLRILEMTSLDTIFPVFENVPDAIRHLGGTPRV